jgi:uncharacterized protein YhaN
MRISRASIDGYGRFIGRTIEFVPGLQIVIGPNEQGKSTLRSFVCDVLYGQKRSLSQRAYDESNELHVPWTNPDCYGGALRYTLDNGHEIEVVRNFDRRREAVQVFNRTMGRDITGDFERLRNREVDFAAAQLGLGKTVFLGAATISHFSLEELGDREALNQIRERLLALADSGSDTSSAGTALKRLQDRIACVGQPQARTKPLPAARHRLAQLQQEYEQALAMQRELSGLTEQRRALLDEVSSLCERRAAVEDDLRLLEAHELAGRLREAENLQARIDAATQQSFALGGAREFPVELMPEVQRAENLVTTAQVQLERTQREREDLEQQLAREAEAEESGPVAAEDVPDELETRLNDALAAVQAIEQRVADAETLAATLRQRFDEAQNILNAMPDFSRISSDPVEWFTQLASSFALAIRSRDEERALRDRLRTEVAQRAEAIAAAADLFQDCPDFAGQAREFELEKRVREEQRTQQSHHLRYLESAREEIIERSPAFLWLGLFCGAFFAGLLGAYVYLAKTAILYAVTVVGLALFYFLTSLLQSRSRLKTLEKQIAEARAAQDQPPASSSAPVEELVARAGVETVRELEAMYDQYRSEAAELAARRTALNEQEIQAAENEAHIPQLLTRLRETFAAAGETIENEDDVTLASRGVIERYQSYREAKRAVNECRVANERQQAELKRLTRDREAARETLEAIEEEVRQLLRGFAFSEEAQYETAAGALRAYRQRAAQFREQRGRATLLKEKLEALTERIRLEAADLEKRRRDLTALLARGGVNSVEQWRATADQARQYREIRDRRAGLEAQLNALLREQSMNELRKAVENTGELPPAPPRSRDQLRTDRTTLTEMIEAKRKEEHALHVALTERAAGLRAINEIEEERAAVARRVDLLDLELEAASHAMTLIEHIASDKHARIAPRLAGRASEYLAEITAGAYGELTINRELEISIRIPQTNRFDTSPEKSLSKGTVDQVYLALRLAFVQALSESGETIPMLLDDPFANYDNTRLDHTMRLLTRLAAKNQILLFTCRDDVATAGETAGASVIWL